MSAAKKVAAPAAEPTVQAGDALARVAAMAFVMVSLQQQIDEQTAQLKKLTAQHLQIELEDLPELMRELTLTEIRLADGSAVKLVDDVQCGISEDRRALAHEWLTEHGFGGLIKTVLTIPFSRDDRDKAVAAAEKLRETYGDGVSVSEAVHAATLKSFIKEQLAHGTDLPVATFAIHPFTRAKITPPAAPKASVTRKPKALARQ